MKSFIPTLQLIENLAPVLNLKNTFMSLDIFNVNHEEFQKQNEDLQENESEKQEKQYNKIYYDKFQYNYELENDEILKIFQQNKIYLKIGYYKEDTIEHNFNMLRLNLLVNDEIKEKIIQENQFLVEAVQYFIKQEQENLSAKYIYQKLVNFVYAGINEFIQIYNNSNLKSINKIKKQPKIIKILIKTLDLLSKLINYQEKIQEKQKIINMLTSDKYLIKGIFKLICFEGFQFKNNLHMKFFQISIELFNQILDGASQDIQYQFLNVFIQNTNSHQFFLIINERVQIFLNENQNIGSKQSKILFILNNIRLANQSKFKFLEIEQILRFLQLLCENHNFELQQYLRHQDKQKHSINILEMIINIIQPLIFGVKDQISQYKNQENECIYSHSIYLYSLSTILQSITTIIEMLQGPCKQNQIFLSESEFFDITVDILKINEEVQQLFQSNNQEQIIQNKEFLKQKQKFKHYQSLSIVQKYCYNLDTYNQDFLSFCQEIHLTRFYKDCEDFYQHIDDIYNLCFITDEEWVVQELKMRIVQTLESALEANENNLVFQKLMIKIPQELLMLNLIWTYDSISLSQNNKKLLKIDMNLFKQLIKIDYEKFTTQYLQKNPNKTYEVSNVERGFKTYFLILFYNQNQKASTQEIGVDINHYDENVKSKFVFKNALKKVLKQLKLQDMFSGNLTSQKFIEKSTQPRDYGSDYEKAQDFFGKHTNHIEIMLPGDKLFKIYFPRLPIYDIVLKDKEMQSQFYENVDRVSHSTKINSIIEKYQELHEALSSEYEFLQNTKKLPLVNKMALNSSLQLSISFFLAIFQSLMLLIIITNEQFEGDWNERFQDIERDDDQQVQEGYDRSFRYTQLDFVYNWEHITLKTLGGFQLMFAIMLIGILVFKQTFFSLSKAQQNIQSREIELLGYNFVVRTFIKFKTYFIYLFLNDLNSTFYMVYTIIAITSFVYPLASPFLMLIIFKKWNTAKDILIAVLRPWKSLLVIMLIFCIISYYYTIVVFYNYYNEYDDYCKDFGTCFLFIIDRTFKHDGGFISYQSDYDEEVRNSSTWPKDGYQFFQIFFQFTYVMIILVLTIQVIQGLIIDNFTQLRNAKEQQQYDMNKSCFICGIDRIDLDKNSKVVDRGFKYHVEKDHNLWNYMFYLGYITHKEPTECSGYESYVLDCIKSDSIRRIKWLPIQRALMLEDPFSHFSSKSQQNDENLINENENLKI